MTTLGISTVMFGSTALAIGMAYSLMRLTLARVAVTARSSRRR